MLLTACGFGQAICDQVSANAQTDATVALAGLTAAYVLMTKGLADAAAHQVDEMKRALGLQYRPYIVVTPAVVSRADGNKAGAQVTNNSRADAYFCVVCSSRASADGPVLLTVGPIHMGIGDSITLPWQEEPGSFPPSSVLGPKPDLQPVVFFRNVLEQPFRSILGQLTEEGSYPDRKILVVTVKGKAHDWVDWYNIYIKKRALFTQAGL